MRHGLLLLVVGVLFLTSCSSSRRSAVAFGAPSDRPCYVIDGRERSTPLLEGLLRDEFRVPDVLRQGPADTLLLSVGYDSTGAFNTLSLTSRADRRFDSVTKSSAEGVSAARADGFDPGALYRQLRDQFVDRAEPKDGDRVFLLSGSDAGLVPAVMRYECAPRVTNQPIIVRQLQELLADRPYLVPRDLAVDSRTALLHIFVDRQGRATEVRVHNGTGLPVLDDAMARIGEQAEFLPALMGGFPVAVWVSIPFTYNLAPPQGTGARP